MSQFINRNVVVTGSAGGIGEICATDFAREGAHVFLLDLPGERFDEANARISACGQTTAIATDVGDRAAIETAFEQIAKAGGADILVTTAAILKVAPILDFDPEDWENILRVNLTGSFHCAQLAGRQMVEKGWGRIITLSSINGQIANAGRGAYSCTKGGVDALTRLLATELGDKGITANAVAPAPVDTPMILKVHGRKDREVWEDRIPAQRYAQAKEVAGSVRFLASDEAAYINGHILNVDGGFMAAGIQQR